MRQRINTQEQTFIKNIPVNLAQKMRPCRLGYFQMFDRNKHRLACVTHHDMTTIHKVIKCCVNADVSVSQHYTARGAYLVRINQNSRRRTHWTIVMAVQAGNKLATKEVTSRKHLTVTSSFCEHIAVQSSSESTQRKQLLILRIRFVYCLVISEELY